MTSSTPRQILLGGLEPQLRLVAARMQPGNPGGLLEHAAALIGPRLDDLADAALMHQSRRARPGGGVGEHHGDIARAHFAAVDAESRALFAHDAARHFERLEFVEVGGRIALAVVDRDRDFGVVARRALGIAGEDDVVHLRAAHRLIGGFAHHPAHGFDQIGFAAAVRTDDAGQPGLDLKVGRFDEDLKPIRRSRVSFIRVLSMSPAAAKKGISEGARREFGPFGAGGVPHRRGE